MLSFRISVRDKRVAAGSVFAIALASGSPTPRSRSSIIATTLVHWRQSGCPVKRKLFRRILDSDCFLSNLDSKLVAQLIDGYTTYGRPLKKERDSCHTLCQLHTEYRRTNIKSQAKRGASTSRSRDL